jgi:hypothetical protein
MRVVVVATLLIGCGGTDHVPVVCQPDDPNPLCEVYDCHMAAACDATCAAGTPCGKLDCSDAATCRLDCQPAEMCPVDCQRAGTCFIDCEENSSCDVDCTDSPYCTLHCHAGAACILRCQGATTCMFADCVGTMTTCPGGIQVCNRACP